MGGALAGLGLRSSGSLAAALALQGPQTLQGNVFNLTISEQAVNFTGQPAIATAINGSVPAPVLRWKEGERVTLNVTNLLPETSSIHWHGLILPPEMDGVPGISFDGIPSGKTFTYRFDIQQSGTYWYHSHSGFQEQTGMYGAIVIDPKDRTETWDRDYVVVLSDWSDEDPYRVYAKLKKLSHYYNFNERTVADLRREIARDGVAKTWRNRQMWNQMRMTDRDLSDVTGYTYTFLMNGQTPADGWTGLFRRGEKVRLRFINAAAMTFFDVRIPGLEITVVATDGQDIEPVTIDEFRIGVAETFDVIVQPKDDRAYTLFAQAIDRSGYARGTLTPDPALKGEVPAMDPLPILTHGDMGMAHGMDHTGHDMTGPTTMDYGSHAMNNAPQTDHSTHNMPAAQPAVDHSQHNMDHPQQVIDNTQMDHAKHQAPTAMDHSSHNMDSAPPVLTDRPVTHAQTEYGPHVDMRADNPQYRLDDPGVGLRNNGRRVLTYADLRNRRMTPDMRDPEREIELHLTGNMRRYMWSINGVKFADAEPLHLKYGERVRITFVNDTMMNHPMHLHGMWSDLETGDEHRIPRKHTVVVQPGSKISYRVTADAFGSWAYHCHLLYHMPGMFRKVTVS